MKGLGKGVTYSKLSSRMLVEERGLRWANGKQGRRTRLLLLRWDLPKVWTRVFAGKAEILNSDNIIKEERTKFSNKFSAGKQRKETSQLMLTLCTSSTGWMMTLTMDREKFQERRAWEVRWFLEILRQWLSIQAEMVLEMQEWMEKVLGQTDKLSHQHIGDSEGHEIWLRLQS